MRFRLVAPLFLIDGKNPWAALVDHGRQGGGGSGDGLRDFRPVLHRTLLNAVLSRSYRPG